MPREQKIVLLINLIEQLKDQDKEEVISLITYTVQNQERHQDPAQKAD